MDDNDKTLQSYQDHIQEYVGVNKTAPEGEYKAWIDRSLEQVPKEGRILELGSAYGRDAIYIQSLGYHIETTDAVQGFIDLLHEKGFEARKLNALTDDFGSNYNMVFANAVFLHFTPGQFQKVLLKVKMSLKPDGILAFSVKKGTGAGWSTKYLDAPRYFQFWEMPELREAVQAAGFTVMELTERTGSMAEWLHVIARK